MGGNFIDGRVKIETDAKPLTRRDFFQEGFKQLALGLKGAASALYSDIELLRGVPAQKKIFIRPPGALQEKQFLEKCTRCNECVKVCPPQAVMKFVKEGSVNHLTPILNLRKAACVLCEDFPCIEACLPAALVQPVSRRHVQMGMATINSNLCYAWQGADCDYCFKECPFPGEAITLDDSRRPHVIKESCTGCGLCEHICPSRQPAITVGPNF
jgi:MauM/NapG family ferredoxin protein